MSNLFIFLEMQLPGKCLESAAGACPPPLLPPAATGRSGRCRCCSVKMLKYSARPNNQHNVFTVDSQGELLLLLLLLFVDDVTRSLSKHAHLLRQYRMCPAVQCSVRTLRNDDHEADRIADER